MKVPADLAYFDDEGVGAAAWALAVAAADACTDAVRSTRETNEALRRTVRALGDAGVLRLVVGARDGGVHETVRSLALAAARERLAHTSPLADLAFAMQGLGSYPLTLAGAGATRSAWLPRVAAGTAVAAIALTEPEAGSDLGNAQTRATKRGSEFALDGEKVFISNAGVADFYTVLARTGDDAEKRKFSAFVVPADAKGLTVTPTAVLGEHPIGRLTFRDVRVSETALLGGIGDGMSIALGTLHRFRTTVGAAAVGFAARALDETRAHVLARTQFGAPLAELQAVQLRLADMAAETESSRLLVYRAARLLDSGIDRETQAYASSMAKYCATESAQRVIDHAVQLHGGRGVDRSHVIAQLYDEVRSLRIYEGTSDVQRLLIARGVLAHNRGG
ncbi:MAG: acyl-CoA dehydrogenase [Myxococcales bacterium]|nr:acyl-CoA dehydrogenase [Myxococcales bacterium]